MFCRQLGGVSTLLKLSTIFIHLFLNYLFVFGFAGSVLLCGLFASFRKQGLLSGWACGLLSAVASPAEEHRLSCSAACRIFLDQGSNLCLLRWQAILCC